MKLSTGLFTITLLASCLALPPTVLAADPRTPAMPCWQAPDADFDADKAIDSMRANLKKMDAQLEKIRQTKDSAARQPLLQEYATTLGENMRLSHALGGQPMMGYGGGPGMMGYGPGMMGYGPGMMGGRSWADPSARIEQMEKRLELMQKRLDQLKKAQPAPAK